MHAAHNYLVSNTPLHHILPRVMWSILSAPRPTGRTAATKYPTFIRSSRRRITSAPSRGRAAAPRGTKVPQRRGGRLGVTEDDATQHATSSGGDDVGSGQRSATTKKMTYTYLGGELVEAARASRPRRISRASSEDRRASSQTMACSVYHTKETTICNDVGRGCRPWLEATRGYCTCPSRG